MVDDKEQQQPNVADQTDRDHANIETERAASFRTTVPEFMSAPAVESATNAIRENETVAYHSESAPHLQNSSHSSLSGLLGRFQYVRTLGQGAFGAVILAWDPELQAHRALKIPHQHLIDSGKVNADSYIAEARKMALLGRHPGIVTVLDVQRMGNGTPFVVSEFVEGGSLADRLNTGRMSWREAVELVAQIADAVAHAHSKGLVHRDLKPANILLNEEGRPVVVDFGMALGDDEFSYRPSICGTYCYMSPQQIRGEADRVDGRSDIFSLGVILYQLLAGRVPYKSRDVSSLKREILHEEATPVRQYSRAVPPELEAICQKAMAKEPKDRYSTAADFSAALRQVLAAPITQPLPAKASMPRWQVAALIGGAALLLLGLFGLIGQTRQDTAEPESTPIANPLNVGFEASVIKPDGESWVDLGPMNSDKLPLQVGDQLRLNVQLDEPRYIYIYWIDYLGDAVRKWPPADADLSKQVSTDNIVSPPPDAQGEPQGWVLESSSGPEAVFVGVSAKPLGAKELQEFESKFADLPQRLPEKKLLTEFEFPAIDEKLARIDGNKERIRGSSKKPAPSAERLTVDHPQLRKWFEAYRGWVFETR